MDCCCCCRCCCCVAAAIKCQRSEKVWNHQSQLSTSSSAHALFSPARHVHRTATTSNTTTNNNSTSTTTAADRELSPAPDLPPPHFLLVLFAPSWGGFPPGKAPDDKSVRSSPTQAVVAETRGGWCVRVCVGGEGRRG